MELSEAFHFKDQTVQVWAAAIAQWNRQRQPSYEGFESDANLCSFQFM